MLKIVKVIEGKISVPVFLPDGAEVLVEVSKVPKPRSKRSNRYYWAAIVDAIVETTGYKKDEVHEYLKMEINPKEFPDLKTGEIKIIGGSTREMTSFEFAEFTLKAKEIAEFCGAKIGSPEQFWESLRQ